MAWHWKPAIFFLPWEKNVTHARTWFKRPRKPGFAQVFFKISLYAKRYQEKWKWDIFNYTNLWVYRNLSRHATWHQRSYQIALKQGNQNPQNKFFFRLDGICNWIVELSNSLGWEFESTIKFNASTGEEYCENDLSVVSVVLKSLST